MALDITQGRRALKDFDFGTIFIDHLGWDHAAITTEIALDDRIFALKAVAEKRGMVVFACEVQSADEIPARAVRLKIDRQVAKQAHEHIIIYTDAAKSKQVWQWVRRETGKPSASREYTYYAGQPGDPLIQRLNGIAFTLDEEEGLNIVDVVSRVKASFDVERVTKRFYDQFKSEHKAFLKFLEGIPDEEMERWYVSVMLNRLMFIYFIQKKNFLNDDHNYLRTKLEESRRQGADCFYRLFLCPLFFEGFAKQPAARSTAVNELLGHVPYLNGGLFMRHQIEELHGQTIQITDAAFAQLFDFFDRYQWNLDERPLRADNEINPDVLGYIFEKYINQKQMGAYYTKEDITGYISKNTVIPSVFDAAKRGCKIAFEGGQSVWRLLQEDPDRYIYEAVQKGVDSPLPEGVAAGLKDVAQRTGWNKPAPEEYALPTEIWREAVARRQRYEEVRAKLAAGEITDINDFITYNLDIHQFAQDVIDNCEGPELLRAFYHAIESVTVLDPACGSGAFLFAALNILEPLYEACLERMRLFLEDLDASKQKHSPEKCSDFRKILARVDAHPNLTYFILKSIIVNNLYGVDIMQEATEICKLRLFLKLVAQIDHIKDIEPLPDIDFNIRAGNTLVGFATYDDVERSIGAKFDFDNAMGRIDEKAQEVERLFALFREQQTELGGTVTTADKEVLKDRLKALEDELNRYLGVEYGVAAIDMEPYEEWLSSHKPFHWFIEFYGIIKSGGFDVIIGNPPYVSAHEVDEYRVLRFKTEACNDLYAYMMERALLLSRHFGWLGFIVPMSCFSVDGFSTLQNLYFENTSPIFISNWSGDAHPSRLFQGVDKRLEIVLARCDQENHSPIVHTSKYLKWYADERNHLFNVFPVYEKLGDLADISMFKTSVPKINADTELAILERLLNCNQRIGGFATARGQHKIFYTRKVSFFLQFLDFIPVVRSSHGELRQPSELKELRFEHVYERNLCLASLSSALFYWFNIINSDCRNLNKREVVSLPIPSNFPEDAQAEIEVLIKKLMKSYEAHSTLRTVNYVNQGEITVQYFNFRLSKPIIDQIDRVLAKHYGFTDEELDFIINYDIKYRMGRDNNSEG